MDNNGEVTVSEAPSFRAGVALVTVVIACLGLSACGASAPPDLAGASPSAPGTVPTDPQGQLAGLVAAAQDHRYVAAYRLVTKGRADRTLLAALATDGTWQVNVPGGALGGGADVTMVGVAAGVYQCLLGGPATQPAGVATPTPTPPSPSPSGSPSASPTGPPPPVYTAPSCVRVASASHSVPSRVDPVFEHLFTDWPQVLINQNSAISVSTARQLPGSTGACYSVEPNAASLAPEIDPGIFCYAADGTLTAAALAAGTLTIMGAPAPAPPTTALPAPLYPGPAAPTKAPDTSTS